MSVTTEELGRLLRPDINTPTIKLNVLEQLSERAIKASFSAGDRVFATGDPCKNFVFVTQGTARVQISSRAGRDMILYRLQPGQSCALTTSCLLTDAAYYAEAIADTALEIIAIPAPVFLQTLETSPEISLSILTNYAQRIGELTKVVDRLLSRDINTELAGFLRGHADASGELAYSHQSIANELGTSREVVSRKLKALEKSGVVGLSRGCVSVLKPDQL